MTYLNNETDIYFNIHLNEIPELSETSKLVYSALFTSAYITNQNIASSGGRNLTAFTLVQKDLSKVLKINKPNISKSIQQLTELNLISTWLSDDKINTFYKINNPTDRTEITEFNKYTPAFYDVEDGVSYNPNIVIPAEIIQLNEIASIRLAIAELQFVWMKKEDRSQQYYSLCNLTQAEKILHKDFRETLRTLKAKGYISYEVSKNDKYKGFANVNFNLNPAKEIKTDSEKTKEVLEQPAENNSPSVDEDRILSFLNDSTEKTTWVDDFNKKIIESAKIETNKDTDQSGKEEKPQNEKFSEYRKKIEQEKEQTRKERLLAEQKNKERELTETDYEEMMAWAV